MNMIKEDVYVQWKIAEKECRIEDAIYLKDLYCILVKNQIVVLGFPLFHN